MENNKKQLENLIQKRFLTVRDIRFGREVRPCRQLDSSLWYARLWSPVVGWMGNVYLGARSFPSREECQAALERAALAGPLSR